MKKIKPEEKEDRPVVGKEEITVDKAEDVSHLESDQPKVVEITEEVIEKATNETLPKENPQEPALANPPLSEKKNQLLFCLGGLIAGLIIGLTTITFFLKCQFKKTENKEPKKISVKEKVVPTPTPVKKVLKKNECYLEVLNGSGIAGMAKKGAEKLTNMGFTVVKIGNADDDYRFKENRLYLNQDFEDFGELLLNELKIEFDVSSISGTLTEGTASARLIIGKAL